MPESPSKGSGPAELRRQYPSSPSDRFVAARREIARTRRRKGASSACPPSKKPEEPPDPFSGLRRYHDVRINRPYVVPSGACTFFRDESCTTNVTFPGVTADLTRPSGIPLLDVHKRLDAAGQDLPREELPALRDAFIASATDSILAGHFPQAAALSERMIHLDGKTPPFLPAEMTPRVPATARIVRDARDLPRRQHSTPRETRPVAPLSLPWASCSRGALLMYSKTTVVRDVERRRESAGLESRGGEWPLAAEAEDWVNPPVLHQGKWPGAFAVGPPLASGDMYFEIRAELAAQVRRHFESRTQARCGDGQRPLLHIGVTAAAPPDDPEEQLDEPHRAGEQCWLMSTLGHVYSEGVHSCTVPVDWPLRAARVTDVRPVRGHISRRFGLFVTDVGALQLFVDGSLAASSPPDTMPRALAWGTSALFPMVVLGPNIGRATLLSSNAPAA